MMLGKRTAGIATCSANGGSHCYATLQMVRREFTIVIARPAINLQSEAPETKIQKPETQDNAPGLSIAGRDRGIVREGEGAVRRWR